MADPKAPTREERLRRQLRANLARRKQRDRALKAEEAQPAPPVPEPARARPRDEDDT